MIEAALAVRVMGLGWIVAESVTGSPVKEMSSKTAGAARQACLEPAADTGRSLGWSLTVVRVATIGGIGVGSRSTCGGTDGDAGSYRTGTIPISRSTPQ